MRSALRHGGVVLLQVEELSRLLCKELRRWHVFHSIGVGGDCLPDRSSGGCLILVSVRYAPEADQMTPVELVPGRASALYV